MFFFSKTWLEVGGAVALFGKICVWLQLKEWYAWNLPVHFLSFTLPLILNQSLKLGDYFPICRTGIFTFFNYLVTEEEGRLLALLLFLFGIYKGEASMQVVKVGG